MEGLDIYNSAWLVGGACMVQQGRKQGEQGGLLPLIPYFLI